MTEFCMWMDIQDLITCATFGDDRLWSLGVAMGRISHFLLTCVLALTTFALPCDCVMLPFALAIILGQIVCRLEMKTFSATSKQMLVTTDDNK